MATQTQHVKIYKPCCLNIDDDVICVSTEQHKGAPTMQQSKKPQRKQHLAPSGGMTLDDVAKEMGLTRERVRQIEVSALAKAKKILEQRGLTLDDMLP